MDKGETQRSICPPCGENVPRGTKEGQNKKNTFLAPPTPPNGGTPSTREGDIHPLVRTHQNRSKNLQSLARQMRRHLTLYEVKLWKCLQSSQLGATFRRQYLIANKYIADFVCLEKKLIIEVDGSQHCDNLQDVKRTKELTQMGFQIIRFWNLEIDRNLNGCVQVIIEKLRE